jgi:hypothetical protein
VTLTIKPLQSICFALLIAGGASSGCRDNRSDFATLVAFSQSNRSVLGTLISDIQKQTALSRVIWSEGREFITVIYRDGRIVDGYSDDKKWQPEIRGWIERLKAAGCHGFDDRESATCVYLDIQTFIAVPSRDWRSEYASWAEKDRNPDGYRCTDLGQGWYLTTEKN